MTNAKSILNCGILLIFEGTRNSVGQTQTEKFVTELVHRVGTEVPVICAFLDAQKPNLPMAFRRMNLMGVRRWLCVPLLTFSANYGNLVKYVMDASCVMKEQSDVELHWIRPWGTDSQLISLVAGMVTRMLLDYTEKPRILLVGGKVASTKLFRDYREAANRIAMLTSESIEPCVLTGIGPSAQQAVKTSLTRMESVLVLPYQPFEGLILQKLRQTSQRLITSRRQQYYQADGLFVHKNIQQYLYTAIQNRLYQMESRSSPAHYEYA